MPGPGGLGRDLTKAPEHCTGRLRRCRTAPASGQYDAHSRLRSSQSERDRTLALDLRKPQDYFHRVWSTAFRAADLADAGIGEPDEYDDPGPSDGDDPEQDIA
ncbi:MULTISPECIES: hypothetical protein [unclassified Streptomyces]|uniref:hypothetical protein n=1 Tax=unclassified Streptomyces TaxID=2593676 RepID=UPI00371E30A9